MADIANPLETEGSALLEPEVDISEEVTVEALETLNAEETPLVMTEGDDSVFYSEDEGEEIAQDVSICAPRSSPQIQDAEFVPYLSQSAGLMDATGSVQHSGAMLEEVKSLMESNINHISSSASVLRVEGDTGTVPTNSAVHNEELLKPSKVQCAAQFPVQEKMQVDNILPAHAVPENVREPLSEQATGTLERDAACAGGNTGTNKRHEETDEPDENNESFENLSHTKFGTVSYRRIRRGLTRKRIEEFEAMMQS